MDGNVYWMERVLAKLYELYLEDRLSSVAHYWVCDWDDALDISENLVRCKAETKALTELSNIGVIGLEVIDNYFLEDPKKAENLTGVARYFSEIPLIMNFDYKKFADHCSLIQFNPAVKGAGLPDVELDLGGGFRVHKFNVISYRNREIQLAPQVRNVAALIMRKSPNNHYASYEEIIDNCFANSGSKQVINEIRRSVSEARSTFKSATGKKQDFFKNQSNIGYIFRQ